MLAAREVTANAEDAWDGENYYFRTPLFQAIRLGYCDSVERLIAAGASIRKCQFRWAIPSTLRIAGKEGHYGVIVLVLSLADDDIDCIRAAFNAAAEHQRWELVLRLLERYGEDIPEANRKNLLCWAAAYGADEMVLEIVKHNVRPCNKHMEECGRYPLHEAVRQGHLSSVKLLLDNRALGDEIECHFDLLARYVTMSGNFEIFQLLREQWFWRKQAKWVLLPVAADFEHMNFARFAVGRPVERRRINFPAFDPEKKELLSQQVLRFSVFRALISGHLEVNTEKGGMLEPLVLAVNSGNADMVRLLTQELNVDLLREEHTNLGFDFGNRNDRYDQSARWAWSMFTHEYFTKQYHNIRQWTAGAALQIANGRSS
ncbi:ankyrin [Lentithecium fluviatile CBS 122367]|uniref:Ankyrin n=1 Tax=Lentithecium fluviatile CBS 122367 TaxID=1168545 RepID=A0A6G1J511_9PLEO|nr:ankyrin [Lentithecium fluviatile CBS 122367]